jgi:hypothetical protein
LVFSARREIDKVDRETVFSPLVGSEDDISNEQIQQMLARSGRLALAGLLAQTKDREAHHAAE